MSKKDMDRRKKFILELMGDPIYQPMRLREISSLLRLSKEEKRELYDVLDELCEEGKVSVDRKGRYEKVKGKWKKKKDDRYYDDRREEYGSEYGRKKKDKNKKDKNKKEQPEGIQAEGTFIGHPKGFGFVEIEGQDEDIFIPESDTGTAMHQDKVRIIIRNDKKEGKRQEGVVVKVLERGMPEIVGTYQLNRDFGFVISDNPKFSKDIFIPRKEAAGIKNGDKVIVVITDYGSGNKNPEGKIKENLGNIRTPGTDILAIVKSFGIPSEFPEKVMKQAQRVPDHVLDADRDGRLDLRHLQTVTIDGEDAKDLDDAISLTKEGDIYHLGVHIADVSNYVQYNSALDREALKRGTSVYLADRVVPMLPERLSNGICSLNQGEDRLALSCLMDINEKGKVVSHQIAETVINVNERMCYTDVKNILEDTDEEAKKRYEALIPMFFMMKELSGILRNSRHHRGSIDFDFPESKIILNAAGKAIDVKPYEANVATKIIEDFMLMANETVPPGRTADAPPPRRRRPGRPSRHGAPSWQRSGSPPSPAAPAPDGRPPDPSGYGTRRGPPAAPPDSGRWRWTFRSGAGRSKKCASHSISLLGQNKTPHPKKGYGNAGRSLCRGPPQTVVPFQTRKAPPFPAAPCGPSRGHRSASPRSPRRRTDSEQYTFVPID